MSYLNGIDPRQLLELVEKVQQSPKYAQIDTSLISRIGLEELNKGRKLKEAVKGTKNKLHQVAAAYLEGSPPYAEWLAALEAERDDPAATKALCRQYMRRHASSRERLPILEDFYQTIFASLPPVETVLDLACGFNPLALPWMGLPERASYIACDVYYDMLFFVGKFLEMQPVRSHVEICDLTAINTPAKPVDLALALKTIPCLEQADEDAGRRLLDNLNAEHLVVSFPAKSLGGKEKGMAQNYEARFTALVEGRGWVVEKFEFDTELAFVVHT